MIRAGILQEIHKQYITYQLLKALFFLHTAELIHRDVKPSNSALAVESAPLRAPHHVHTLHNTISIRSAPQFGLPCQAL